MARTRFRGKIVPVAMMALAIGLAGLITSLLSDSSGRGKLRLPVGTGTPAISLGDWHLPIRKKIAPLYPYPAFVFREEPWQLRNE